MSYIHSRPSYWILAGQRKADQRSYLNLAPMMDVMFNLLIFFLVATTFQMPEGAFLARLPKSTGLQAQLAVPVVPIRILLQKQHGDTSIYVSYSATADDISQAVPVASYEELYNWLVAAQSQAGFDSDSPVILMAKDNVDWQQVMQAYNSATRAGFSRMVFSQW